MGPGAVLVSGGTGCVGSSVGRDLIRAVAPAES
jgi:hypothetical protein